VEGQSQCFRISKLHEGNKILLKCSSNNEKIYDRMVWVKSTRKRNKEQTLRRECELYGSW
jgi:hypothetical protein